MTQSHYRVLARAYRPQNFDDLVGQDVLVRTLTNAFSSGRIAHAFLLTGIRGIGKTTTARIIARGLNCFGPDGKGGPTTRPCGECPNCKMILEERHVDVIEMDAASRTGVDDIRELIDTVHYAPAAGRYKIYIIDEVHMLSKNAFNALLKTLEEPPAHVIFIFATTELRKIPVTIISRCQRFDLRRLDMEQLATHLANIAQKESVRADEDALKLIATAAEGSVRDALSLLDQAISLSADGQGNAQIEETLVRDMLGLADKSRSFDLLGHAFGGDAKQAILVLRDMAMRGGDPVLILQDLLELTHFITRIKLAAGLADNIHYSDIEQQKAAALAENLGMAALTRAWQLLLKGLGEAKIAPQPLAAAEMILVRLAYASTLPPPEQLLKDWQGASAASPAPALSAHAGPALAIPQTVPAAAPAMTSAMPASRGNLALAMQEEPLMLAPMPQPVAQEQEQEQPQSFAEITALFERHREPMLYSHLYNDMRLVRFSVGLIEVAPARHLPADIPARIGRALSEWTGRSWRLTFSDANGEPTLYEQAEAERQQMRRYAETHASTLAVKALFPGAELVDIELSPKIDNLS